MQLTNGTSYDLDEREFEAIKQAVARGDKNIQVQGDFIMVAAIVAIQGEDKAQEALNKRNGRYECVHGFWHDKYDKCYGHVGEIKPKSASDIKVIEDWKKKILGDGNE